MDADRNTSLMSNSRQWQIQLSVVNNDELDAPAAGHVVSWWPLRVAVQIQAGQLDYFNRVAASQAARDNSSGVVWASRQIVQHIDQLIELIADGMMDAHMEQAVRFDRVLMVVAVLGLGVIPVVSILGCTIVMICMMTARIGWSVALWRNRQLRGLLAQLADSHDARVDGVCLMQLRNRVMRWGQPCH